MEFSILVSLFLSHPALAYNPLTHEQITRNALTHLASEADTLPETRKWLDRAAAGAPADGGLLEEALVRGVVDADYRTDLWLDGWFHDPFTGAHANGGFTIFTGMFHYLNVTVRGDYWDHDGYAYRHGSHADNDAYLDTPSATIMGALSPPLGGRNDAHPLHGIALGKYNLGFKGSERDWRELFFGSNDGEDAVFPPASVPAQLAFDALQKSAPAAESATESWNDTLPLVTGLTSTGYMTRHYWRGEIKDLPKGFDLLGLTLHLAQDVTVPQHAAGTADWCHQELEDLTDRLACGASKTPDSTEYRMGSFGGDSRARCNNLYDPELIRLIRRDNPFLDPKKETPVGDRLRQLAELAAEWQWGDPNWSADFIGTILPDGSRYSADRCKGLMKKSAIQRQIKYQYNLAVAASAAIFETAAYAYESRRASRAKRWLPPRLFDFFRLFRPL